ncbi:hypothetical protein HMPREF9015_01312 [Leptotrichia wadei F0279]|uniref:Uncharacterized protein n=1 Tax=Leptotrichia wadei (strain F0279) TaxID=888055 RepID=U2PGG6_LEPWF|nr:hypothetical protein HMPREF9015_01312 [Leptotrichia wadei F0279]
MLFFCFFNLIILSFCSCIFKFFVIDFSRIILNLKSVKLCRRKEI